MYIRLHTPRTSLSHRDIASKLARLTSPICTHAGSPGIRFDTHDHKSDKTMVQMDRIDNMNASRDATNIDSPKTYVNRLRQLVTVLSPKIKNK
jgi:hypothetical protein